MKTPRSVVPSLPVRNPPTQARSQRRLARVLDAAEAVLAKEGSQAFTTRRIALAAGLPIGAVYRFFPDKETLAGALAVRYWSDVAELVEKLAQRDAAEPLGDPTGALLEALAAGFRARPGFLALWFGELRTERMRDVTRPAREALAASIERILAHHWPATRSGDRHTVAAMLVLAGDGLLREAFRAEPRAQARILRESRLMLDRYVATRLGGGS